MGVSQLSIRVCYWVLSPFLYMFITVMDSFEGWTCKPPKYAHVRIYFWLVIYCKLRKSVLKASSTADWTCILSLKRIAWFICYLMKYLYSVPWKVIYSEAISALAYLVCPTENLKTSLRRNNKELLQITRDTDVDFSKILGGQTKIFGGKVVKSDKCIGVSGLAFWGRARAAPKVFVYD